MNHERAVFDKGTSSTHTNSYFGTPSTFGMFRCTEKDKRPARRVLTAQLLGDPPPGRTPPISRERQRISTLSGPVLLTFRELEAARRLQDI